jgi:hypothetical protein
MHALPRTLSKLPNLTGRVNTLQLAKVEAEHFPPALVRLAAEPELTRRAEEIAREEPEHADEAKYAVEKELHRRACQMSLTA